VFIVSSKQTNEVTKQPPLLTIMHVGYQGTETLLSSHFGYHILRLFMLTQM